ncbi:hypothetical protein J7L67_06860 [bacterium]|nr:hypothetical protein [bacterium]
MIRKPICLLFCLGTLYLCGCADRHYVKIPSELFFYNETPAQPLAVKDLIEKIDAANTEIDSFKADLKFTFNDFRKQKAFPFTCKGKIAIEKPYNLRLVGYSFIAGTLFDLTSNGKEFYLYLPKEAKILKGSSNIADDLSASAVRLRPNHVLESFFMNNLKYYYEKYICFYEYYPETYVLYFVQENKDRPYLVKKIWVNDKTFDIIRHETFDSNGLVTLDVNISEFYSFGDKGYFPKKMKIIRPNSQLDLIMEFSKVDIEPKLNAKTFVFDMPEGVEIYNLDSK